MRPAELVRNADVEMILDITAGVPHVFQAFLGTFDEADHVLGRATLFLGNAWPDRSAAPRTPSRTTPDIRSPAQVLAR